MQRVDRPAPAPPAPETFSSLVRLLRLFVLRRRAVSAGALLLSVPTVAIAVLGPLLLGRATDLIVAGVLGRRLPAGISREQAIADLRADGETTLANMVAHMAVVPGQGVDFTRVGQVLAAVLVLYIATSLSVLAQGRLITALVQEAVFELRREVEHKLARLPLRYFDRQPRGELLSRATNDVDNLGQVLQQTAAQLVTSMLSMLGALVMMLVISPLLAAITLLTVPLLLLLGRGIGRRAQRHFAAQMSGVGRLNGFVEEMYTGHSVVRIFDRAPETERLFVEQNDALRDAGVRAQFVAGTLQPAMMFLENLTYVLLVVVGALRVAAGQLSVGGVQAFVQYARGFGQPVAQVAGLANLLQSAAVSAQRVFAVLDAEEQCPDPDRPGLPETVRGRVEFHDVCFRYDPGTPLIEGLSLRVEPGQTVAVVGPTGAGKTTLVNLLMRFYEFDAGRITLDGLDIAASERGEVRARMGMVLQDVWLFSGTIEENIAYGAAGATRADIVKAAEAAHVDRFVRALPDGYRTVLRDGDGILSEGERQLVTVARAFLADPAVLILDEATSSVDTRTELLVQQAMRSLRSGRTSFVIAHRLSTIRDADVILVMEAGRIVERGDHATLLRAGGIYARLHASRFDEDR